MKEREKEREKTEERKKKEERKRVPSHFLFLFKTTLQFGGILKIEEC